MKLCPCGTQKRYLDCCGIYLLKKSFPETPEALMRSRYTAFVEKNADYIRRTMKEPALLKFNKKEILKGQELWCGLEVLKHYLDENDPTIGYVEFKAKFKLNNEEHLIHELSKFQFDHGRWYYIDGVSVS